MPPFSQNPVPRDRSQALLSQSSQSQDLGLIELTVSMSGQDQESLLGHVQK
jgi:hypothetical protein